MRSLSRVVVSLSGAVLLTAMLGSTPTSAASAAATITPMTVSVSRSDYGMNVFSYDSQMNSPSTITGINQLGLGMQQFPNANEWSWTSNTFQSGGTGAVSLSDWGHILQQTNNQGLFIFNYDENPTFTGGGTPSNAAQLTHYIVQNHLPITAIVIGSEEYGAWDHYANLNPSFSAQYYATQTAKIIQAIHGVDPSMKVGVSFDLGQQPDDLNWDQTLLRVDGPYINFVSIHDYPNAQQLSDSTLLAVLPSEIGQATSFVKNEITANVPPQYARNIQTWVTEYNPYGEPGPQSTQSVYGAAMVESAMLWRVDGASKLFVWSYDGQAHSPTTNWPVNTSSNTSYGLFALAGDGQAPELPENQLYPSGQALQQYMQAIGSGATLSVWVTNSTVVGQVGSAADATHIFAINTSNSGQSVSLSNSTPSIPAASMTVTSGQTVTSPAASLSATPSTNAAPVSNTEGHIAYQSTPPTITGNISGYPGQTVTIRGTGFETQGPNSSVIVSQSGLNYGGPGDSYGITIKKWSPTRIRFIIPNGTLGPSLNAGPASIRIETAHQLVSPVSALTVNETPSPDLSVQPGPIYPGGALTISGSHFGSYQSSGYVIISQNGMNYGGPSDSYKVNILKWSNNAIMVQVPDGSLGPALSPGTASITVVSGSGIPSQPIGLTITEKPPLPASLTPSGAVLPGQTAKITGAGFGTAQGNGYLLIQQNGVNYGAPGDWYGVTIVAWNPNSITFRVPQAGMSPTGHDEPALKAGNALITIVTNSGQQSEPLQMNVN